MANIKIQTQPLDRDEILRLVGSRSFRAVKFLENLGKDVGTTIPDAIAASVVGPSSAVDDHVVVFDGSSGGKIRDSGVGVGDLVRGPSSATNNAIALFNGASGKLIKDSAVLLNSLAPLASPALTGNPTAPTPALGDNDTSIATTAFVHTELANGAAYFSAHNNGVAQSVASGSFQKVNFSTEDYDVGSAFASSRWTPPAGRPVSMVAATGCAQTNGTLTTVAIYKNGAEFKRGNLIYGSGANSVNVTVSCMDVPNGTDFYEVFVNQQTGVSQNLAGGSSSTYFQGTTIRP